MKKTSLGELIANAISHGIGVLLSIAGLVLMIVKSDSVIEVLVSVIFGVSLVCLYLFSTLFHSFPESMKKTFSVFQRLDHSGIFILITGTYTPFLVLLVKSTEAYVLLGILWTLTILGVVMKSIWIHKFKYVHLAIYLLMGWSILFIFKDVYTLLGEYFIYLLLGGLCYSVGVIFYVSKFKYQHFVWHIFVLMGSLFHFVGVYFGLL